METIAKVLKAFFFGEDGEVDTTFIGKLKKALTWIVIGAGLTIGGLCYWVDDEDVSVDDNIEYVSDSTEISE